MLVFPFFVVRPDGSSLYSLRDAVYAVQKINAHDLSVNVVGGEQCLAQEKVLITSHMLTQGESQGEESKKGRLCHFPYGLVKLTSGKMSGRRGRYVLADDLLDDLEERVLGIMTPRWIKEDTDEEKKQKVEVIAKQIASAALKIALLNNTPVMRYEQTQAPFILYNVTRINTVLKKAADNEALKQAVEEKVTPSDNILDGDDGAWGLFLTFVASLPSSIKMAAMPANTLKTASESAVLSPSLPDFGTHIVCDQLANFAASFSSLYKRVRFLPSDFGESNLSDCLGWMKFLEVVKKCAETCLEVLAIDIPEFM
ncbi:hypothetical protein GEMRC1_007872 [Eukaryota sp. GEM-RC1]